MYTDREAFSMIAAGSHQAFDMLVDRYQGRIFSHAMGFLKDSFKAQDLVQDVFLSIWKARHKLDEIEDPESYIFITTRNKIATAFKKKFQVTSLEALPELGIIPGNDLIDHLDNKELLSLIQSAVDKMPPQRKQVFEMGKKAGLKYEEIGEQLNISPNTVKVHMVQALAFIRYFIGSKTVVWWLIGCCVQIFFQND